MPAGPWEQYAKPAAPAGGSGPWSQYGGGGSTAPDLGPPPEEPMSVGGFLGNVVKSGAKLAGDVVNMVAHPVDTIQAIGGIPVGLWTKAGLPVPKDWNSAEATKELDGIVQHLTSRYGSLDAAKRAMYEDPVGVAADASAILGGVAGGARAAGLTRVARVAEAVNPANLAAKGARAAAPLATKVGNAVIDASQNPVVRSGAKVAGLAIPGMHGVAAASVALDAAAEARAALRTRRAAKVASQAEAAAPAVAAETAPPTRLQRLVKRDITSEELFGPMSEIPPEASAPPAAAEPVRLRNPATEAPRDRITLRNPEPPPMTDAEVARMRGEARREIVLRNKPEPPPVVEAPPSVDVGKPELPPVEATPAGSMDDLRRGVQSILDRRKSSAAVNKPAPMSEQPAPIIETPAPEAPKPVVAEPAPQSEPVRLRNPVEDGAAPDYETKPRAAKVEAFVEHLRKYNFTPELVDAISDRQWSAVAQSAGQNAPSAETIAAIKEKFGAGFTPKKQPAAEKVTLRNPDAETPANLPEEVLPQQGVDAKIGPDGKEQSGPLQSSPQPGVGFGDETSVLIPGETGEHASRYRVRELADVQSSHNGLTFQENPRYQLKNERNYSDPANQERIVLNSQQGKFNPRYLITDNPDALNGPPVVDSSGNIIGGNSRGMILQRVYGQPHGQAYKAELVKRAARYGINPDEVAGMNQPVLVREIPDHVLADRASQLIRDTNKAGTAELTPAERAVADGKRLGSKSIDYLQTKIEQLGPNSTLREVLASNNAAEIINKLVDDGVFSIQEKPSLIDGKTGAITEVGKDRIESLLVGRLFRDSDQFARTPAAIRDKLSAVSGPISRVAAHPEWNLQPVIGEAIDLLEQARAHGIKNLRDVVSQQGMFGAAPEFSENAVKVAEVLNSGVTRVREAFKRYAADSAVANGDTPSMFDPPTQADSFSEAFGERVTLRDPRKASR